MLPWAAATVPVPLRPRDVDGRYGLGLLSSGGALVSFVKLGTRTTTRYREPLMSAVFVNAGAELLSAVIRGKSPRKGRYV